MSGKLNPVVLEGLPTTGKKTPDEILRDAIAELEARAARKSVASVRCQDNVPIQDRLVKLIGDKPIFGCKLNGVSSNVLWDTGSQVALIEMGWLKSNFPGAVVHPISDFVSEGERVPKFRAANDTEIEMVGSVVLDLDIGRFSVPVPFLITESPLAHPIIGYNVFKHIIDINTDCMGEVVDLFAGACSGLDEGRAKVMVDIISKDFEDDDFLGDLRATKPTVIPPKGSVRLKCRVKGDVKGLNLSFICSEPCIAEWDDEIVVTESLGELVRGRTPHVNIELRNCSSVNKFIQKNQVVGEICAIKAVHPIKLFNSEPNVDDAGILKVDAADESTFPFGQKWQPKANLDHLPEHERKEIEELLFENCDVFARNDTDIGEIPECQMDINLTDEIPVNQAYRHLPRKLYDDVKNYISDLIVNGWVQESSSPYASPIVCVRKKDGSLRLCVDYRKLNLKTVPDRQPIPRVQDLLDGLHGQKYFSTLDMAKAYHQGYVRDICRKYTAFSTPWALFEWLRIPFGLKNAPAAFQKFINQALSGLLDKICLAYLDDILIYGKNFKEHKQNLRRVLKRLKSKGVKLRVDKCDFVKPEVRYLGRLVSGEGYRPDPVDVKALEKFREAPKSVGEVRSLLGFLGYYRNYVKDFAKTLKPVYDLLKVEGGTADKKSYDKRKSVSWSSDLQSRVDDVINTLQSPEVMAYPDFESPFILTTDASGVGLGSVLYQKQGDEKKNRVISYASRTLSPAEKNYYLHSGKLEFLALKWAVTDKFPDYLGHGSSFTVFTDNNPLTYVMTSAKLNATGMRWVNELAGYDFTLKYRPGKENGDADGLSRKPLADLSTLERECTESCDCSALGEVLTAPVHTCAVSADLLEFPDPPSLGDKVLSFTDLRKAQMEDDVVGPVYQSLVTNSRPERREWQQLPARAKVLFRQWKKLSITENGVLVRRADNFKQIVLPSSFHDFVYTELHQKMAHLGSDRVFELARRRFFWPHMAADIDSFCQKKCPCITSKAPNVKERAQLVPIHATRPFEIVSVDFMKLDLCKGGFQHVLVVVDHFTRFAQAYPTKRANSRSAADKLFNHFILQYGFPARIHHDLGKEFNSNLFKHLHALTGIAKSNTTPYHPQGDGQCERLNRTVINMLKSIPEDEKDNWKTHIPKLMFAYNATINKTTLFSPFFLLFGREPRLPIDSIFPDVDSAPAPHLGPVSGNRDNYGTFVNQWNARMNSAFDLANQNIDKSANYNKNRLDRNARCEKIVVGDRVVIRNFRPEGTTRAAKLASYWDKTVYVVTKVLQDIPVFVLQKWGDDSGKTRVLHRNHLKCVNNLYPVDILPDVPVLVPTKPTSVTTPAVVARPKPAPRPRPTPRPRAAATRPAVVVSPPRLPPPAPSDDASSSDSDDSVVVVCRRERMGRPSSRRGERSGRCATRQVPEPALPASAASSQGQSPGRLTPTSSVSPGRLSPAQTVSPGRSRSRSTSRASSPGQLSGSPSTSRASSPGRLSRSPSTSRASSPVSFHSALDEQTPVPETGSSWDEDEDVTTPPRRTTRVRREPKKFTYDQPGCPLWKQRGTSSSRSRDREDRR